MKFAGSSWKDRKICLAKISLDKKFVYIPLRFSQKFAIISCNLRARYKFFYAFHFLILVIACGKCCACTIIQCVALLLLNLHNTHNRQLFLMKLHNKTFNSSENLSSVFQGELVISNRELLLSKWFKKVSLKVKNAFNINRPVNKVNWSFKIIVAVNPLAWNAVDIRYWRCVLKKAYVCPDNDIKFYLYTQ